MLYRLFAIAWTILATVTDSRVDAKDYFLTLGGGYDPSGNQISLEKNVVFLQEMLADLYPEPPQHTLFFADGNDPARDLQYLDKKKVENCPPAQKLMSEVFGCADSVGICYRNHEVSEVSGPTERAAIQRRFRELGRVLHKGDRLIVYVTGHGGAASEDQESDYDYEYDEEEEKWVATSTSNAKKSEHNAFNTTLYLWDHESVEASEFGRWLDRISPEVPVVLVMVQCYAGGFANSIFHRNNPELGLSPSQRCGFFSQVHDRAAAGCSPDVNDADYQEYSAFFWSALRGKSRTDEALVSADYDDDQQVSFAEAHAYAVLESNTIDIPVRTSDVFLRRYSRLNQADDSEQENDEGNSAVSRFFGNVFSSGQSSPEPDRLTASGLLAGMISQARPDQRAILEQLPQKLELTGSVTVEAVRLKLRQAKSDISEARVKLYGAKEVRQEAESDLEEDVCDQWPELNERFTPTTAELTNHRSDEFAEVVAALASYKAWSLAKKREDKLTHQLLAAQCVEAKVQRLLRTIENVVLAANLSNSAPAKIVERYHQLIAMEEGTLATSQDHAVEEE